VHSRPPSVKRELESDVKRERNLDIPQVSGILTSWRDGKMGENLLSEMSWGTKNRKKF